MNYQPKRILVTGGAGFIGANFIRYYLTHDKSAYIVNLDKLTYAGSLSKLINLPDDKRYKFIQGDIIDTKLVTKILAEHTIDTIVHFAAESHVDRSIQTPGEFIQTNIVGTYNLLEAAKQRWLVEEKRKSDQCRFHHISTDEVFGALDLNQPAFTEQTAYQPRSPYSASKAGSDHLVQAYHHTYGLPTTLSNCSNNFGPWQHPEKFIPTVIKTCLSNSPIPIYGAGNHIRDWLYVEDHCRAIHRILTDGNLGESYTIGGNNEWTNLALAKLICQTMDKIHPGKKPYASLLTSIKDRPGHDFRYAVNNAKIAQQLGWSPQENFTMGLNKTITFYLPYFTKL